ncbi:hypothetical protein FKZ61_018705 [Litorilinea aerophila]|uniref:Bacterial transcriptional activator domain-containing protein n=1 Tax=Litorilinea aerophila TaxID=1204385 RepID=A0A540VBF1_9CHLR|nr:BTAD domain-containing putative transcriptional regulator [Litorilinea aerophila]MCC9078133.1 hypothetical protein [Litorilinea aerophila]
MCPSSSLPILERPRLYGELQELLAAGHVALVAPAGYGKSVLLRALAARRPHAFLLQLEPADADLARLQARWEALCSQAQDLARATLLLDDIQHLEVNLAADSWLAAHLQADTPRLVLAGRRLPGQAVRAQVAAGRLRVLSRARLAFTPAEAHALLASRPDSIRQQAWVERAQGWPLALGLLARSDPETHLPAVQEDLFAYLATTLYRALPPPLRHFWQLTALPRRIHPNLAATLLGDAELAGQLFQQILQRSLFLEPAEEPGWYRYHDLIRDFLRSQAPGDLTPTYRRLVAWFTRQGEWEMAIEHALEGGLHAEAASLIQEVPEAFLRDYGRYATYRRWVNQLTPAVRRSHPAILIRLARHLHRVAGLQDEAWPLLQEALALGEEQSQGPIRRQALGELARLHYREGHYDLALAHARRILEDPDCPPADRLQACQIMAVTLAELARFGEARQAFQMAIDLAQSLGDRVAEMNNRTNLALLILVPQGRLADAQAHIQAAADFFQNSPGRHMGSLLHCCELHTAAGDWASLVATLDAVESHMAQVETPDISHQLWHAYYAAIVAVAQGYFQEAQVHVGRMASLVEEYPMALVSQAWVESWLLRRQGRLAEAVQRAEATLARDLAVPFYRAVLALERDIARGLLWLQEGGPPPTLHPETRHLVWWRARGELVRLRALLALCAHAHRDPRWQRHAVAALAGLARPAAAHLLTSRDPELGMAFWSLLLAEGVAADQARSALVRLGDPRPMTALLAHPRPQARVEGARLLATLGDETAIPTLLAASRRERNPQVRASLAQAVQQLQTLPPPPLTVTLMGQFSVLRGDTPIPPSAWPRPVVRRLFQYLVLHRGQPLHRDRILEEFWPDTSPDRAWTTFRSVQSRLRQVLEPYTDKGINRYLVLEEEVCCFDPLGVVHTDVERLTAIVQETLHAAQQAEVPPLPAEFLAALEGYAPLLPELAYEDWALRARVALADLFVDGCLHAAHAWLVRGQPGQAEGWARRVVAEAPWLEEGYELLIRALARQGHPDRALKAYEEAVAALRRELDAPPSEQLRWLARRLRQGEAV